MSKNFAGAADPMSFVNGTYDQVGACGADASYGTGPEGDAMAERLRRRALMCAAPSQILPFVLTGGSTNPIAASTAFTAAATPVNACKVQKLIVAASIAPFFTVSSIKAGRCTVFESDGDFPCDAFTGDNQTGCLELDVVVPGTPVTWAGKNQDVAGHSFFGGLLVLELKGPWGALCSDASMPQLY